MLKSVLRLFRSSLLFILYSSCGYHSGLEIGFPGRTVSVPFIQGDEYGMLSAELVHQLSSSGVFLYRNNGGSYLLKVKILRVNNSIIGFKRSRELINGLLKDNLHSNEGRQTILVEASLLDSFDRVIWGPKTIMADVDYDYVDPDSLQDLSFIDSTKARRTVLNFSLGQLESIDSAQGSALQPLYRKIAKKVVDAVIFEWRSHDWQHGEGTFHVDIP